MKPTLRSGVLRIHRWTGMTVGLVILMMALTGAMNLFRPALESKIESQLLTVPACNERVALDVVAANAAASHGHGELDYLRIIAAEEGAARIPSIRVRFAEPQEVVYVNPCNGAVLGEAPRYGGFFGRVEQLHILRYSEEKWVRSITAVCAIAFGIVLLGGGVYMWWPRRGVPFRTVLKLNPRLKGRARDINLHKTFGVYVSAVLVLLILTGLPLAFDWYRNGLYTLTGSPLPAKAPKSKVAEGARISMETFWQRVQAIAPAPAEALLKFPRTDKADSPMESFVIERGAPHPNARTMVFIDAYSGQTLRHTSYADSSPGHKLYFWTLSFHTGQVGGVVVQAILLAAVLTIPLLAYTGIASYLRRRGPAPASVASRMAAT